MPEDELGSELHDIAPTAPDSEFNELDRLTAEAKTALGELDDHNEQHVGLALKVGSLIASAKKTLPHGEFQDWCNALGRSPSWCSAYRRLFENREHVQAALEWASATKHKWAPCRSVERLLKLIAEYKKTTGAVPDGTRRKETASDGAAALEKRLNGCEKTFVAMVDAVAPFWVPRAFKLIAEGDPRKALAELALRIHARASDPDESCSALQVWPPEAARPYPGTEDADVGPLLNETRAQGGLQ